MRRRPLSDSYRLYMTESEYETSVESAPDRETRLAMRIIGECSPRIGLTVDIERGYFYIPSDEDVEIVFLDVRGAKDTTEDDTGGERITWVPMDLYEEIIEHCKRNNISEDEQIFSVDTEQMRNKIKRAGSNAANKGDDDFNHLTPHDLRAYYATNMLRRKNVDKEIVKAMGGWGSDKAIQPYLDVALPRDIQDELARNQMVEPDVPTPPMVEGLEAVYKEIRELREQISVSEIQKDHDLSIEDIKQVQKQVEGIDNGNSETELTSLGSFMNKTHRGSATSGGLTVLPVIAAVYMTTVSVDLPLYSVPSIAGITLGITGVLIYGICDEFDSESAPFNLI